MFELAPASESFVTRRCGFVQVQYLAGLSKVAALKLSKFAFYRAAKIFAKVCKQGFAWREIFITGLTLCQLFNLVVVPTGLALIV